MRNIHRCSFYCAAIAVAAFVASASHAAQPPRFHYQAKLTENGGPLTGSHVIFFYIYQGGTAGVAESGTKVFQESVSVNLTDGILNHSVGTGVNFFGGPLNANMFRTNSDVFLMVAVDALDNYVLPRTRLDSVPYAINSADGDARQPLVTALPITISQSGSYYFTQNLTAVSASDKITITADNVTLDLNGYSLVGIAGATDGILFSGTRTNIVIKNGTVRSWPGDGIDATTSDNCQFYNLRLVSNTGHGLFCDDDNIAHQCSARTNGKSGISFGGSGIITECVAADNGTAGAFAGIHTGNGGNVSTCHAGTNSGNGIETGTGASIRDCNSRFNSLDGFNLGEKSTIVCCVAEDNTVDGIDVSNATVVTDCSVSDNHQVGIRVADSVIIEKCTVRQNLFGGILASSKCTVLHCIIDTNTSHGIALNQRGLVRSNVVSQNIGPGIYINGDLNRIEENSVMNNGQFGILTSLPFVLNAVTRNFVSGHSTNNYAVGGNKVGPVADPSSTTSPWANF